jgi:hypothetical protein
MARSEASRRLEDNARIKRGNDALVRLCIIGFALAIAAILPVPWGWKIGLFLGIIFAVGVLIPAVGRARKNPFRAWRGTRANPDQRLGDRKCLSRVGPSWQRKK